MDERVTDNLQRAPPSHSKLMCVTTDSESDGSMSELRAQSVEPPESSR